MEHECDKTLEQPREAIQEIAEELDAQLDELPQQGNAHVNDYMVPQEPEDIPDEDAEDWIESLPIQAEERDVFAVLDTGLPEPQQEEEEILRTELGEDGVPGGIGGESGRE